MLDTDFVRSQYRVFNGGEYADWAFFENAGGSLIPEPVLRRFVEFLSEYKVQPHGPSAVAARAGDAMEAGYRTVAELLNADEGEIVIGPSTTLNAYVLAQALRATLQSGDEIVVTDQDHEANVGCWRRLEAVGATIRTWRIDPRTGMLDPADLENLLSDRTRLVCFTLCSNVVGAIHEVRALADAAHASGALVVGDGVSYAPHAVLDVEASGLDFYLFSTYKTFAPHTGVMWVRAGAAAQLEPQGHYFHDRAPRYALNPTGPLHAEIAALAGLRDYVDVLHARHFEDPARDLRGAAEAVFGLFHEHEEAIAGRLLDYLRAREDVRIVGPTRIENGNRSATIAFTSAARSSASIAQALGRRKIACGHGHFYARRCVEALGIDPDDGVVRISMVHYNNDEDTSRLLAALDEAL